MRFAKGHGTANDFVIIPDPEDRVSLTAELVAALCDRRTGIGADGVLRVVRDGDGWFMDYRNADGSLAATCGNGLRVFARYLVDTGLASPGTNKIRTRAGWTVAVVSPESVAVDMGQPKLYAESRARVGERDFAGVAVEVGNPNLVCRIPDTATLSTLDLSRPPVLDPSVFPAGANVEFFVPVGDMHVAMRVHERGVGETLSCGSGACAVAAIALRDTDRTVGAVTVDVPGGRLEVTFDGAICWLAGPAVIVFSGEVGE